MKKTIRFLQSVCNPPYGCHDVIEHRIDIFKIGRFTYCVTWIERKFTPHKGYAKK